MKITAREASRLFGSKQIAAVADGDFSKVEKVSSEYLCFDYEGDFGYFYDLLLEKLGSDYRSEYYYKNYIAKRHLLGKHSLNTATMLSEFRVGKSKADCVILNGISTCYEIKTDYDSLVRLDEQISDYSKVFDKVYVVCGEKKLSQVVEATDSNIGILLLTKNNYLSVRREAVRRNKPLDRDVLAMSLRKEEYTALAGLISGEVPDVPNSKLFSECRNIISSADDDLLERYFLNTLKESRANNSELIDAFPSALLNAAISFRFDSKQVEALKKIFEK